MSYGFFRSLEGGHQLVSQLLGVPVTPADVVLQPVRGLERFLTKGTQRPWFGSSVHISKVSGKVLLENYNTTCLTLFMAVVNIQVIILTLVIGELHVLNVIVDQGWSGDDAVNILASITRGRGPSEGPSGAVPTAANVLGHILLLVPGGGVLGQPLDLQQLGSLQEGGQVGLVHSDLTHVDELEDGVQIQKCDIMEKKDRVLPSGDP